MPHTGLRVFSCTTKYTREGLLVVDEARLTDEKHLAVNLADVVRINTLAAPLRRVRNYHVLRHELRLLLSFVRGSSRGSLTVRQHDLLSSARHISAFFIESLGLGVLTAAVQARYAWTGDEEALAHFDVLPSDLIDDYLRRGVRPDLLFSFPDENGKRLAGEARGRSDKRHKKTAPSAKQRTRLNQMLAWSQRHDHHPVTMTWTFTGEEEVKADLFDITLPPLEERREPPAHYTLIQEPEDSALALADLTDAPVTSTAADGDDLSESVPEESLFTTAPATNRTLGRGGAEVRGDWVAADLFGSADILLLLGVLPERLGDPMRERVRTQRNDDNPVQIAEFGRLLFVTATGFSEPPSWSAVLERLGVSQD